MTGGRRGGCAAGAARMWGEERRRGQMVVEMAVMVPVAIVVALVAFNLLCFVDACAAFDQAALDAIVSRGVSPSGQQTQSVAVGEVRAALEDALGREGTCEVEVRAEQARDDGSSSSFLISPLLTRYVCTLTYRPWPRFVSLPGITLEAPVALRHERELVVDRYRPGVVM